MSRRPRHRSTIAEDDIKYAPGVGARVPPSQRPLGILERATIAHVAFFSVAAAWAFGGQADWAMTALAWWGSIGFLLTLTSVQDADAWRDGWMRPLIWAWPFIALNVVVLLACLNPSFRPVLQGTQTLLVQQGGREGLLSTANPALTLRTLWIFDGVWIACYNLALIVRQRRALRLLLLIVVTNALGLGLFGVVQKFARAHGMFFGAVPSPLPNFFATFVDPNQWGAFVILMCSVGLGLVWHYGRRREARDFFQTPAFAGMVIVVVLAGTVALSMSRSATMLGIGLLSAACVHGCFRLVKRRRQFRESTLLPVAGGVAAVVFGVAAIGWLSNLPPAPSAVPMLDRATLQHDTWEMAKEKPWFGWGLGSYAQAFPHYSTQKSVVLPTGVRRETHNDWLQNYTELGVIGTGLLALCALVPLFRLRPRHLASPVPAYLLAGCTLVLFYAALETLFSNVAVMLSWWLCFFAAVQYARLQDREAPTPKTSSAAPNINPTADCSTAC